MPDSQTHQWQAQRDESFARQVDSAFLDMGVIAKFDAAFHYIDAKLAEIGIHLDDLAEHEWDNIILHNFGEEVWRRFCRLKRYFKEAKYEVRHHTQPFTRKDIEQLNESCVDEIRRSELIKH